MPKFITHQVENIKDKTDWIQPVRRNYRMGCCDCGLVHNIDFRIKNGRVQFRAGRNTRSTAQLRRHMKKRIK